MKQFVGQYWGDEFFQVFYSYMGITNVILGYYYLGTIRPEVFVAQYVSIAWISFFMYTIFVLPTLVNENSI
jgi:hypothetical protein